MSEHRSAEEWRTVYAKSRGNPYIRMSDLWDYFYELISSVQAPEKRIKELKDALVEADAAIVEYLEWGPMTGSDRDYHAGNLKRAHEINIAALAAAKGE